MKPEPVTREQFEVLDSNGLGAGPLPETQAVHALSVGEGLRFKNHKHDPLMSQPSMCKLQNTLRRGSAARGIKITCRHDGRDLVVFRLTNRLIQMMQKANSWQVDRITKLTEALTKYGVHLTACDWPTKPDCSCGLETALAQRIERAPEPQQGDES